ncbi:leucine-rich repeat and immunoglobulin-like domain-containing nogo receptor-interacting protein 4 [Acanthaster planci]|uniref:Leucine-rich repeat and immunoglobulin-like domain-containing nogo receptor-interacting protein 4 n=1 Tax=Acanthaster planci TaxID=133434 RepID=A0A8B7XXC4_ACAPL|nr:leucine-rich repeat and immunoglobulin-like domain-containing nogo receptor-interacting protein 4 [Acanthaster planci]
MWKSPSSSQCASAVAIVPPLLWLLVGLSSNADGATLEQRRAGNRLCTNAACEDDEPGKFNCGSRQLKCIPQSHTDVRVLDLHGNLLTNLIERSFSHYRRLQNLDLSMNEISIIAPGAFTGLTNLTSLILKLNKLQALTSGAFTGAQRLRTLDLSLNNITVIQPGTFTGLTSLRKLFLQENDIKSIDRGALFGLQSLNLLALQNNRLQYIHSRSFDGMTQLQTLQLSENNLASLPDLTFLLPTLQDIWISGNPINCDCRIEFLRRGLVDERGSITLHISHPILCVNPPSLYGIDLRYLKIPLICKKPKIAKIKRLITAEWGKSAILPCNATGIPEPNLSWTNPQGGFVTHKRTERVAQQIDGSLRISEVREEDTGNYTCYAQNGEGTDLARILLIVSKPSGRTGIAGDSDSLATQGTEPPCTEADATRCKPDHDPALICDSTAGIIATALVTFSTTLSTALIFFYIWYRRHMDKMRPRVPRRQNKHRGLADGQEACLEVQEAQTEHHTLQRVINAIASPKYLYAKPTRRIAVTNKRTTPLRMNKVEDSAPKHGRYIGLSHLRKTPQGSREKLNESPDYLPLTTCNSSNCSGSLKNRDSYDSTDSHLYENAVLMIRDPNYTALDPATRCGVRKPTEYVAI